MLVIQATMISGKIIDDARWEITSLSSFQKNNKVSVELATKDPALLTYLSKTPSTECILDGDKDGYSILMSCVVSDVRHMIHATNGTADTMVLVVPANRLVEHVMQYILNQNKCDPRFLKLVKGETAG